MSCDMVVVFFASRRRHTRFDCNWSSDVCSSDLAQPLAPEAALVELVPLDHRAHRAIEQYDALPEQPLETLDARAALGLIGRLERVGRRDRARRRRQVPRSLAVGAPVSCRRARGGPAGALTAAPPPAAPAAPRP